MITQIRIPDLNEDMKRMERIILKDINTRMEEYILGIDEYTPIKTLNLAMLYSIEEFTKLDPETIKNENSANGIYRIIQIEDIDFIGLYK